MVGGPNLKDGLCHHVAVVRDGIDPMLKVYIDGVLYPGLIPDPGNISSTIEPTIGRTNGISFPSLFKGVIKELRVWAGIRSQSEILSYMNSIPPHPDHSLIYYFRFNEGSGTTINNYGDSYFGWGIYGIFNGGIPNWVISCPGCTLPGASINASGSTSICAGSSVLLNANTGTSLTYQWKLNGNNISGATSFTYSATTPGNYSVVVSNSCGSSSSNVIIVTIQSAPNASITALGPTSFCMGNSVTLTANTGSGLSYQWRMNGSPINGATNSTFNATGSGNYSVIVSNNCGNSISNIISVAVTSVPGSTGAITGPSSVCKNSTQSFSVSSVASATSYIWTVPPQAQIISGAGTNSVVVKFKTKQGNVTVKPANQCGTGPLSVLPVQVINCSNSRNSIPNPNLKLIVYPNPSISDFTCLIPGEENQLFELRIFNQTGRIIEIHENITANNNFTFGDNLVAGFYFVEIISGGANEIVKVVKIK